jgi:hypothetical protein
MDEEILVVLLPILITSVVSLVLAILSYFLGKKNQTLGAQLEIKSQEIASELADKRSKNNAQLDYIYEARKRLYTKCDPLFFFLKELSEEARQRIIRLAQAKKEGHLPHWMDHDGYFFLSTIYMLIVPVTVYKLIQKQLTLVDLSLDHKIVARYQLIKCVAKAFRDDFKFAKLEPAIPYDPEDIYEKTNEPKERKQGLHAGRLDNAAEALIVKEEDRCMSWGEFTEKYKKVKDKDDNPFDGLVRAFKDFDSEDSPVLWRILVTQYYLYYALTCACDEEQESKNCPEIIKKFIDEAIEDTKMREELEMDEQAYDRLWRKDKEVAKLWLEERLYKSFKKTDLRCSQRSCSI